MFSKMLISEDRAVASNYIVLKYRSLTFSDPIWDKSKSKSWTLIVSSYFCLTIRKVYF